jgi:hypothetical protein
LATSEKIDGNIQFKKRGEIRYETLALTVALFFGLWGSVYADPIGIAPHQENSSIESLDMTGEDKVSDQQASSVKSRPTQYHEQPSWEITPTPIGVLIQVKDQPLPKVLQEINKMSNIRFDIPSTLLDEKITAEIMAPTWTQATLRLLENFNRIDLWEGNNKALSKVLLMSLKETVSASVTSLPKLKNNEEASKSNPDKNVPSRSVLKENPVQGVNPPRTTVENQKTLSENEIAHRALKSIHRSNQRDAILFSRGQNPGEPHMKFFP